LVFQSPSVVTGGPASRRSLIPSYTIEEPDRCLTLWILQQKIHTVSCMSCFGAWTSAPLHTQQSTRDAVASTTETLICICARHCWSLDEPNVENGVEESSTILHDLIFDVNTNPPTLSLPRPAWVRLLLVYQPS